MNSPILIIYLKKNNTYYKYNIQTLKFEEITKKGEFNSQCPEIKRNIIKCSIGENEKCKTCNIYEMMDITWMKMMIKQNVKNAQLMNVKFALIIIVFIV